jgi:hypothetical protein
LPSTIRRKSGLESFGVAVIIAAIEAGVPSLVEARVLATSSTT